MTKPYTAKMLGLSGRLREAFALYRSHKMAFERVGEGIAQAQKAQSMIETILGRPLEGLKVLDAGPGQFLIHSFYFALRNEITAIDFEVIPWGFSPFMYLKMLKQNGLPRFGKTLARKVLGVDRRYVHYLKCLLRVPRLPHIRTVLGDLCSMHFDDNSFDVVHCRSVVQHIPKPDEAISEMVRVLKPRGVLYLSLHLYTAYDGCLDPRLQWGHGPEELHWAHLRPLTRNQFEGNVFLNRWPLDQWLEALNRICPGHVLKINDSTRPGICDAAIRLIKSGELSRYTLQELIANELIFIYKKETIVS